MRKPLAVVRKNVHLLPTPRRCTSLRTTAFGLRTYSYTGIHTFSRSHYTVSICLQHVSKYGYYTSFKVATHQRNVITRVQAAVRGHQAARGEP